MTPTTIKASNPKAEPTPAETLHGAFDKLVLLRSEAKALLNTNASSQQFDIKEAGSLTQQIRGVNQAFKNLWESQITQVLNPNGTATFVWSPDFLALKCFLNDNSDRNSAEDFITGGFCKVDNRGFITEIGDLIPGNSNSFFILEPLERLKKLESLSLDGAISRPSKIARLSNLQELRFTSSVNSDISPLKDLPLKKLTWHPKGLHGKRNQNEIVCVDISSFSAIESLESLSISIPMFEDMRIVDFAPLAKLRKLENFELIWATLSSNATKFTMPQIKKLKFGSCKIEDLSILESLPELRELALTTSKISCQTVKYPAGLNKISLYGSNAPQLSALLKPLLDLDKLHEVDLREINEDSKAPLSDEEADIIQRLREKGVSVLLASVVYATEPSRRLGD